MRFEVLGSLLSKVLLKDYSVSGVRTEQCIYNISKEWNQSNAEVHHYVEIHLGLHIGWKTTLNLLAGSKDHKCHEGVKNIADTVISCQQCPFRFCKSTYPGTIPITLLQPNRTPNILNKLMSRRYARRLTFVRTFPSCSVIPGGNALRTFFVFFFDGLPSSLVAGTVSKYGS